MGKMLRWFPSLILLAATAPASAQDTVLGLPKPRDARHPGAVVLVGGGGITNGVWNRFFALAGGSKARVVIVPSAGFRPSDYNNDAELRAALKTHFADWLNMVPRGKAASVEFLYTDEPKDADDDAFVRPLAEATAVWFSGGLQSRLNYRFVGHPRQSKFQNALRDVIARGGVVGGTSAGMAALPEIMTISQQRQWSTGPMEANACHGLGVFSGAIVDQHFDTRAGRLERFTGLLRDTDQLDKLAGRMGTGARMVGLAVDEGTGLVLQGNHLEALGRSNVEVFLRTPIDGSLAWHTLHSGEQADLQRDGRGGTMLVRPTP
jgi:cyanophycinase